MARRYRCTLEAENPRLKAIYRVNQGPPKSALCPPPPRHDAPLACAAHPEPSNTTTAGERRPLRPSSFEPAILRCARPYSKRGEITSRTISRGRLSIGWKKQIAKFQWRFLRARSDFREPGTNPITSSGPGRSRDAARRTLCGAEPIILKMLFQEFPNGHPRRRGGRA
jgi:hypothetical protein